MVTDNNALADFVTVPAWIADGMANWIDQTEPTDGDADSIGCGMAMISYLLHRGCTLSQIAISMVTMGDNGTFAQLYSVLMGPTNPSNTAWPTLSAAIKALPTPPTTDDPFGQMASALRPHKHV
jgi:hypothetical protein